jgi:hypothetical protein
MTTTSRSAVSPYFGRPLVEEERGSGKDDQVERPKLITTA